MIALSTSCRSSRAVDGFALLEALLRLDVSAVELEYRITDRAFAQIREPLKRSGLKVVSVHNYFPSPTGIRGLKGGGDMFSLSDPDRDQRNQAVRWTCRTIEAAGDLEARAVILHCGRVDMNDETPTLHAYHRDGRLDTEPARTFLGRKLAELARKKPQHLESLRFSLDRLVEEAHRRDLLLALENRYHYFELPGPEDFGLLLDEFRGAPLAYWHDTGHAHAQEALGLTPPGELLTRYGERLAGVHLHDAMGLDDHLPPGTGDIDFAALQALLKPETPRVLELKPGTPDADIRSGIDVLRKLGFDG